MTGYLPKESPISKLNKTILRTLWNNKIVSKSLGVKNEKVAREWFKEHQKVHEIFEEWDKELERKIKELQNKASGYLELFEEPRINKRINKSRMQPKAKRNKL